MLIPFSYFRSMIALTWLFRTINNSSWSLYRDLDWILLTWSSRGDLSWDIEREGKVRLLYTVSLFKGVEITGGRCYVSPLKSVELVVFIKKIRILIIITEAKPFKIYLSFILNSILVHPFFPFLSISSLICADQNMRNVKNTFSQKLKHRFRKNGKKLDKIRFLFDQILWTITFIEGLWGLSSTNPKYCQSKG